MTVLKPVHARELWTENLMWASENFSLLFALIHYGHPIVSFPISAVEIWNT